MSTVKNILADPRRGWAGNAGASEADVQRLLANAPEPLPVTLLELLRESDGGEADLGLPPLVFVLDSVAEILQSFTDPFLTEQFSGLLFFGGNGGGERIALDRRGGVRPWPVAYLDPIAGLSSVEQIAPDLDAFVEAIGLESQE
jgi:hypothetical protein